MKAKFYSKKHIPVYSKISVYLEKSNNVMQYSIYWSQIPSVLDSFENISYYKWLGKKYFKNELPVWKW